MRVVVAEIWAIQDDCYYNDTNKNIVLVENLTGTYGIDKNKISIKLQELDCFCL
jgi:hypothetical protein